MASDTDALQFADSPFRLLLRHQACCPGAAAPHGLGYGWIRHRREIMAQHGVEDPALPILEHERDGVILAVDLRPGSCDQMNGTVPRQVNSAFRQNRPGGSLSQMDGERPVLSMTAGSSHEVVRPVTLGSRLGPFRVAGPL